MKDIICILLFCQLIFASEVNAQQWPRIYDPHIYGGILDIKETYDQGYYILGGDIKGNSNILWKSDINGNILWQRTFGLSSDSVGLIGICQLSDGGILVSGQGEFPLLPSYATATFLLKLNACGEKEWCKIYTAQKTICCVNDMVELQNKKIIMFNDIGSTVKDYKSVTFSMDSLGKLNWQFFSPVDIQNLTKNDKNETIISGRDYLTSSSDLNHYYIYNAFAKIDSNGNQKFMTSYSVEKKIKGSVGNTCLTKDHGYLTAGLKEFGGFATATLLIKSDSTGAPVWDKVIGDSTATEDVEDMCKINDSTFIIAVAMSDPPKNGFDFRIRLIKINDNGVILKQVIFTDKNYYLFPGKIHPTSNGKFILPIHGSGILDGSDAMIIYKINENLDFDSFSYRHYTYDSLCTAGVKSSGLITLDGADTIHISIPDRVGIKDAAEIHPNFIVYPNPTRKMIQFIIQGGASGKLTGVILNGIGKAVKTIPIIADPELLCHHEINIESLPPGLYFIVIRQNQQRMVQKFIVE